MAICQTLGISFYPTCMQMNLNSRQFIGPLSLNRAHMPWQREKLASLSNIVSFLVQSLDQLVVGVAQWCELLILLHLPSVLQ